VDAEGGPLNNEIKARAERARVVLEELQPYLSEMSREVVARWQGSTQDQIDERELAYSDWRALQRLQRKLKSVLAADALENPNG